MTTWSFTGRQSLLSLFFAFLGRTFRDSSKRIVPALKILVRISLVLVAMFAFTVAAWSVALPLGLAVGGVCCLVLEWLIKGGGTR